MQEVNEQQLYLVPRVSWWAQAWARLYLWACERLYAELASQYDVVSWIVSGGRWHRWQSGIWSEVRGSEVLELGSGPGHLLEAGHSRGLNMVGVDRSPAMLAVAPRHTKAPIALADGRLLPLAGKSFDTVFATFPAGYVLEEVTLREVRRVLRTGGRLVMLGLWVELDLAGWERLIPIFYGRPHQARLTVILQRVEQAGFDGRWVEQRDGPFRIGVLVAERIEVPHGDSR